MERNRMASGAHHRAALQQAGGVDDWDTEKTNAEGL